MPKIFVEPIGVTIEIDVHDSLLTLNNSGKVAIPSDCGGRGTCGKCLVRLGAGELTPPTDAELKKIPAERLAQGWRLACQAYPASERVSIEVRETRGHRQILTASDLQRGEALSAVTKEVVSLAPASLEDARADAERLKDACGAQSVPLSVLRDLPDTLRDHDWSVRVTRYRDHDQSTAVIDVEPPVRETHPYGAAVDIGTSKIIAYLVDLLDGRLVDQEAVENPQMRFGEDVVTRITQAISDGHLRELAGAAREGINEVLAKLYARQEISARDLYDMTVVGNTAMHHLALGLSPRGLGGAPFAPAIDEPVRLRAAEIGYDMNPEGHVEFLPPIAGFVGSDCLAVVAATRLEGKRVPAMAIDIGTNTEIALVHEGKVSVTSCASGPAFEGYQITSGMKAAEGAIERVTFSPEGLPRLVKTIGHVAPLGICGSGVVDVLAGLVKTGVVDKSGRMQPHERVREGANGREYVLARGREGDIVFTQHDVRALQLAKGAIAAGWSLLLAHVGLAPDDLRHVYVAGAFGNYLDLANALAIDLLPPVPRERIAFVGNAAGVGAQMALIDVRQREHIAGLRKRIGFLELATDKQFHTVFTERLSFA